MKKIYLITLLLALISCKKESDWDGTGTFEVTEITVSSQGNGVVFNFNKIEGNILDSGEFVCNIDTVLLNLQKQQLQEQYKSLTDKLLDIDIQTAPIKSQIEWTKTELARFTKLANAKAANTRTRDEIENKLAVLNKELKAKTTQLTLNNSSIKNQLNSLEASISSINEQINRNKIISPASGTLLQKIVENGEYVTVGKPLFIIGNLNNIYLKAYLPGKIVSTLKIGDKANVFADTGTNDERKYNGIITFIASESEFTPKNIQTKDERANLVYGVKIQLQNDGYLKRGMYGAVKF